MKLEELATGREAAEIFGNARPDEVWRAIRRHGENYPGRIELIRIGTTNAAPRDQLRDFAAWYRENVHRETWPGGRSRAARQAEPAVEPVRPDMSERRAALRAAIGRIIERQESELW